MKITFEEAILELESIIKILENNECTLEDSIKYYEKANQLSLFCNEQLINVENKMAQIVENGITKDFIINE